MGEAAGVGAVVGVVEQVLPGTMQEQSVVREMDNARQDAIERDHETHAERRRRVQRRRHRGYEPHPVRSRDGEDQVHRQNAKGEQCGASVLLDSDPPVCFYHSMSLNEQKWTASGGRKRQLDRRIAADRDERYRVSLGPSQRSASSRF
jgi:hypothetical protein